MKSSNTQINRFTATYLGVFISLPHIPTAILVYDVMYQDSVSQNKTVFDFSKSQKIGSVLIVLRIFSFNTENSDLPWSIGGASGACRAHAPRYGTKFFRFHTHFCRKAPTSGVNASLQVLI